MIQETVHYYDLLIIQKLFANASEAIIDFMSFITRFGYELVIIFALIGFLTALLYKKWPDAALMVVVPTGSVLLSVTLKEVFQRSRPAMENTIIQLHSYSFPSGHSMAALCFYGLLIFFTFKYFHRPALQWWLSGFLALLILMVGLSRIYIGVHFPSDVVGGFTIGYLWLYMCIYTYKKVVS